MRLYNTWADTLREHRNIPADHLWKQVEGKIALHNSGRKLHSARIAAIAATVCLLFVAGLGILLNSDPASDSASYQATMEDLSTHQTRSESDYGIYTVENVKTWTAVAENFYGR